MDAPNETENRSFCVENIRRRSTRSTRSSRSSSRPPKRWTTLEPGDLREDTDEGAFRETNAYDHPDILHTEQLIRLLADERIRYLTSLGKRNYDHPLNRKHPDAGSADDNSRLLAWFLLDALAKICVQYCAGKHVVLSGHFLKATRLRERFEEKLKLARGPVVW